MKQTIRIGVFETNSSSTHSLTMCSNDDYNAWREGKLLYNEYGRDEFVTLEKACEDCEIKLDEELYDNDEDYANDINERLSDNDFYTYDEFWDNEYLEGFTDTYTTKGGEKVVAFGLYGYDG